MRSFLRPSVHPFARFFAYLSVSSSVRCWLARSSIRSSIRSSVRSFARSFVHPSVTSSTRSFVRLSAHPFVRRYVGSFVYLLIHSFVTSFVRSLNRLSVRPFVTKSSYLDLTEDLPHTDYKPVRRKTADYTGHRSWHQHRHQMTITTLTDLMRSTSLRSGEELCKTIMHIILI